MDLVNMFLVYIHMYVCVQVQVEEVYSLGYFSTCGRQMLTLFLRHCLPYFLRQELSLVWNPPTLCCLASKLQCSSCFHFPTVEYANICSLTQIFLMGPEHQTQLLMPAHPVCYQLCLCSPKLIHFFDQSTQNSVVELQLPKGSVSSNLSCKFSFSILTKKPVPKPSAGKAIHITRGI